MGEQRPGAIVHQRIEQTVAAIERHEAAGGRSDRNLKTSLIPQRGDRLGTWVGFGHFHPLNRPMEPFIEPASFYQSTQISTIARSGPAADRWSQMTWRVWSCWRGR